MFQKAINPKFNAQAFTELLSLITKHRVLSIEMARREITDRYAGQLFGFFWTIIHPLLLILIYAFLFKTVFVAKGGTSQSDFNQTVYILSGLIPWLTLQDVLSKSTTVITNNSNLVKQVIFPIEVLPVKGVLASLFTELIFLGLFFIYSLITGWNFHWVVILLPILLFIQVIGMIGIAYVLSAIGPYLRDVKDVIQVLITVGFWLMPILYLPNAVPGVLRNLLYWNPFSYMIWAFQDILFFGRFEHPLAWLIFPALFFFFFIYGYRLFRKLKAMFGNVL